MVYFIYLSFISLLTLRFVKAGHDCAVPVLAEDRVIKYDLLQQFNQLIWQVCGHEGLDCDGHLLWVLRLRQGRLHHLRCGKK